MPEVIGQLRCRGLKIGLVSASPFGRVMDELGRFGLRSLFDKIYGERINKVSALRECCARFDLPPREVYFVGDMTSDMRDGQDAGVKTVGFAADFPFMRPVLTAAGAEVCVDEPKELLQLVS